MNIVSIKKMIYGVVQYLGQLFGWLCNNLLHKGQVEHVALAFRRGIWKGRSLAVGRNVIIRGNVTIRHPEKIIVGDNTSINEYCHIWGGGGVSIGRNTLIAAHVVITSQTHDSNATMFNKTKIEAPVIVGDNVWIGSGAIILPGITIGNNTIIGAGSVVTRNIPSNVVAAGIPAKVIRQIISVK